MAARGAIERELKLGVWAGFELPDLSADGLTAAAPAEHRLEAVYYDTADLRLLRRAIAAASQAPADGPSSSPARRRRSGSPARRSRSPPATVRCRASSQT